MRPYNARIARKYEQHTCMHILCIAGIFFGFLCGTPLRALEKITIDVSKRKVSMKGKGAGFSGNYKIDHPGMTNAVKEVRARTFRFPMGALANDYLFHDPKGFPVPETGLRPVSAGGKPCNAGWFDFDEYMDMVDAANMVPVIMVNTLGHVKDKYPHSKYSYNDLKKTAVEWVRYANIIKKHKIKYWEIGNEHDLTAKYMSIQEYIALFKDWTKAMKSVDPSIHVGAGIGFTYNKNWYGECIRQLQDHMDFIVCHQYVGTINDYSTYRTNSWGYTSGVGGAVSHLNREATASNAKRIKILVTEHLMRVTVDGSWSRYANRLWNGLAEFELIANQFLYDDRIQFTHKWASTWSNGTNNVASFNRSQNWQILCNGRSIQVFNQHMNETLLDVPVRHGFLRVYSSYSPPSKKLTVWLLNKNNVKESVTVALHKYSGNTKNEKWVFTGPDADATSHTWKKTGAVSASRSGFSLTLDPVSVTVVVFDKSDATGIAPIHEGHDFRVMQNGTPSGRLRITGSGSDVECFLLNGRSIEPVTQSSSTAGLLRTGVHLMRRTVIAVDLSDRGTVIAF